MLHQGHAAGNVYGGARQYIVLLDNMALSILVEPCSVCHCRKDRLVGRVLFCHCKVVSLSSFCPVRYVKVTTKNCFEKTYWLGKNEFS